MKLFLFLLSGILFFHLVLFAEGRMVDDIEAKILSPTCVGPLLDYKYFTCSKLRVAIERDTLIVPSGFETDLASIPRWYWSIISPARSDLMQAAIVHDYLYSTPNRFTRKECDSIFYHLLIEDGVSEYTALKIYMAVRIFGGSHFHGYTTN